jgi:hypothetical protein
MPTPQTNNCVLPLQQIAHILTSLSRVFNTDSVLLTLCGEQRVWIRNAIGFAAGEFAWRWAFCGWSLAPPSPQVLVIEDTLKDARCTVNQAAQPWFALAQCFTYLTGCVRDAI